MSKKKEKERPKRKAGRNQIEWLAAQIAAEMAVGLFGRTEEYAEHVAQYYTAAVDALLKLSASTELDAESEVFSFNSSKRMSEKSNAILRGLYSAVYQEIRSGVIREWEHANNDSDRMVELVFGKGTKDDSRFARLFARNREAMEAFFRRKNEHGGLNLSQKVWKYTSQFKEEMELALSVSLGRGDSAATVSRHVRQYLKEPDKLFRRVKDKDGNLKLSKRASAYHPGRGKYRSSYKNAMRVTRTETNMAYRYADYERRQRHPWIVGFEVKRVQDKTDCPLCDTLAGKYPKDFKFPGWHPQCRCYTIDILAPRDEVTAYHRAMLNGEDVSDWQFSGQITQPHEGFSKWVSENQERIGRAAERDTLPYWIKDNPKYVRVPEAKTGQAPSSTSPSQQTRNNDVPKSYRIENTYRNGGRVLVHEQVNTDDSDYEKLVSIASGFAALGNEVKLTPKMSRPPKFDYKSIYGSLTGTKYEGKCPDLLVGDLWYEHEGFTSTNPKRAFANMMNHGLKQSSRLIIDKPDLTDGFMIRSIYGRIKQGAQIDEVWLRESSGITRLLFKK